MHQCQVIWGISHPAHSQFSLIISMCTRSYAVAHLEGASEAFVIQVFFSAFVLVKHTNKLGLAIAYN